MRGTLTCPRQHPTAHQGLAIPPPGHLSHFRLPSWLDLLKTKALPLPFLLFVTATSSDVHRQLRISQQRKGSPERSDSPLDRVHAHALVRGVSCNLLALRFKQREVK